MANNISKYVQLNDYLLLEYEFNKDNSTIAISEAYEAITHLGTKQYFNKDSIGIQNNDLILNSVPLNEKRTNWFVDGTDNSDYYQYFDSSTTITESNYKHDTLKIHIVSGYNFDDISGFLLQVRADTSTNKVDLSNFTWIKQVIGNDVLKFSSNALYLGNRFYDKYVELKIPSVEELGGDTGTNLGQALSIKPLSDVHITYSTIPEIDNNEYIVNEIINVQLPVSSQADNFNAFIAESVEGDYIEFYGTWRGQIIGNFIGDIESGKIKLYTSNSPNDNYEAFTEQYGAETAKWVLMHELYVYELIPGSELLTQKFVFTQEDNYLFPNYFRPIIKNADIATSFNIEYICRLVNRMDGSQIIRKASFSSTEPKKYGRFFERLNVDNYLPYKVYNKLPEEKPNILVKDKQRQTKYVKVFFDTTNILLNKNNEVLPQGTGPLFIKKTEGIYKFKFEKFNTTTEENQRENVNLSGVYNYALEFILDNESHITIRPTYSRNMNTSLGELEFTITSDQARKLLKQNNNTFSIMVLNPDGTKYTFYEGLYYSHNDFEQVMEQYREFFNVNEMNEKIAELELENQELRDENLSLRAE